METGNIPHRSAAFSRKNREGLAEAGMAFVPVGESGQVAEGTAFVSASYARIERSKPVAEGSSGGVRIRGLPLASKYRKFKK